MIQRRKFPNLSNNFSNNFYFFIKMFSVSIFKYSIAMYMLKCHYFNFLYSFPKIKFIQKFLISFIYFIIYCTQEIASFLVVLSITLYVLYI